MNKVIDFDEACKKKNANHYSEIIFRRARVKSDLTLEVHRIVLVDRIKFWCGAMFIGMAMIVIGCLMIKPIYLF